MGPRLCLLLAVLCLGLAGRTWAQAPPSPELTAVVVQPSPLADLQGRPQGQALVYDALPCLGRRDSMLVVLTPEGTQALLPAEAALVLHGQAQVHRARLERIQKAPLPGDTRRRLLAGRIQPDDSQWLVDMAWGPPQRRFMVNLLNDEEHYVYLRPGLEPLLLRFKGGRLTGPLPPADAFFAPGAPPLESAPSPR